MKLDPTDTQPKIALKTIILMRLTDHLDQLYDATLALLYPQACAACGEASVERRENSPACAQCWARTRIFTGEETCCWKCGALALGEVAREKRVEVNCRRCADAAFTAARAVGVYEGALRAAVLTLKREPHVGARVAALLHAAARRAPLNAATRIVPIPLHARRERERGFNQATCLGRALAKLSRLPLDEASLVRIAHAERHRAGMDARARRETVEQAFAIHRPRLIKDETILLIDDVYTTGATVSAAARALREVGASAVLILTLARA